MALGAGLAAACATNPVTGDREFVAISEAQELSIGREADVEIRSQMGVYADEGLQAFVEEVGRSLAAVSHRPDLDWNFAVVDSPAVNAFALPGGYIYLTRGIMAHLNDEAELAGVLGHEIAHVTARHSVQAYSRAFGANLGLLAAQIFVPAMRSPYGGPGLGRRRRRRARAADAQVRPRRRAPGRPAGRGVRRRVGMGSARRRRHALHAGAHRRDQRPAWRTQLALDPPGARGAGGGGRRHRRSPAGGRRSGGAPRRASRLSGSRRRTGLRRQPGGRNRARPRFPASGAAVRGHVPGGLGGEQQPDGRGRPPAGDATTTCC